jgi:hypothetical protein
MIYPKPKPIIKIKDPYITLFILVIRLQDPRYT